MEPRSARNDIQQAIANSIVGRRSMWPEQIYKNLHKGGYLNEFTDDYPDEPTVKKLIQRAIDDYYAKIELKMVGGTITMRVYSELVNKSLLKLP